MVEPLYIGSVWTLKGKPVTEKRKRPIVSGRRGHRGRLTLPTNPSRPGGCRSSRRGRCLGRVADPSAPEPLDSIRPRDARHTRHAERPGRREDEDLASDKQAGGDGLQGKRVRQRLRLRCQGALIAVEDKQGESRRCAFRSQRQELEDTDPQSKVTRTGRREECRSQKCRWP
jgi:hypothetical protein